MNKDVIIALDFPNLEILEEFLQKFDEPVYVKVGMELFYAEGAPVISLIRKYNHKVFLDLKLHDIPNTVASAMKVINKYDIELVNVHATGGIKMMQMAREALNDNIKLIAVTQLTSTSQEMLGEIGILGSVDESVIKLAKNVKAAGLDGVVCSARESLMIKEVTGNEFLTICPGIRRACDAVGDQVRIVTPKDAKALLCDFIVVGRPITQSNDPKLAYEEIYNEFIGGYNEL